MAEFDNRDPVAEVDAIERQQEERRSKSSKSKDPSAMRASRNQRQLKRDQQDERRMKTLGDKAYEYLMKEAEASEDILEGIRKNIETMEEIFDFVGDPRSTPAASRMGLEAFGQDVNEGFKDARKKIDDISDYLSKEEKGRLDELFEDLEDRYQIMWKRNSGELADAVKEALEEGASSAEVKEPEEKGGNLGRRPLTLGESLLIASIDGLKEVVDTGFEIVFDRVKSVEDATEQLGVGYNETYTQAKTRYEGISSYVENSPYSGSITSDEVALVMADYGANFVNPLSEKLATEIGIVAHNTEVSNSTLTNYQKLLKNQGFTEEQISEKLYNLNILKTIGADVSDILGAVQDYSQYLPEDIAEELGTAQAYLKEQGALSPDVQAFLESLARGDMSGMASTSMFNYNNSENRDEMMNAVMSGEFTADQIIKWVQGMYEAGSQISANNHILENETGIYSESVDWTTLIDDFSAFRQAYEEHSASQEEIVSSGLSGADEQLNNLNNSLSGVASWIADMKNSSIAGYIGGSLLEELPGILSDFAKVWLMGQMLPGLMGAEGGTGIVAIAKNSLGIAGKLGVAGVAAGTAGAAVYGMGSIIDDAFTTETERAEEEEKIEQAGYTEEDVYKAIYEAFNSDYAKSQGANLNNGNFEKNWGYNWGMGIDAKDAVFDSIISNMGLDPTQLSNAQMEQILKDTLPGYEGTEAKWWRAGDSDNDTASRDRFEDALTDWYNKYWEENYMNTGVDPFGNPTGTAPVDGSHANGLNSVPYDGYIAELHEGERVLTADQAYSQDNIENLLKDFMKTFSSAVQFLGIKIADNKVDISIPSEPRVSSTSMVR